MHEIITTNVVTNDLEVNRDPLTGTPGAHPLGTGFVAAAGGLAGAAAGMSIGGPVCGIVGAAVGAPLVAIAKVIFDRVDSLNSMGRLLGK